MAAASIRAVGAAPGWSSSAAASRANLTFEQPGPAADGVLGATSTALASAAARRRSGPRPATDCRVAAGAPSPARRGLRGRARPPVRPIRWACPRRPRRIAASVHAETYLDSRCRLAGRASRATSTAACDLARPRPSPPSTPAREISQSRGVDAERRPGAALALAPYRARHPCVEKAWSRRSVGLETRPASPAAW